MRHVRSRIALLLLAALALVAGACVDDGELGGPSVGGSLAASVGDAELTHDQLADLVDGWSANPQFIGTAVGLTDVGTPAARPADLVNFVLSFWVQAEQARVIMPELNPSFDIDAETAAAVEGLTAQFPTLGNYDESFQQVIAEAAAYQSALVNELGQGVVDIDVPAVEVNPRYGSTVEVGNGIMSVQAPEGPRTEGPAVDAFS